MSKALLVIFHENWPQFPRRQGVVLFDYFLKHLAKWKDEVDHVYLVNSVNCVDVARQEQLRSMVKKLTVFNRADSHWGNMNTVVPQITEDKLLLIDSDMIIYDRDALAGIYSDLDTYDIVSLTDSSGSDLFQEHDFFLPNEDRDIRRRFTPYLFACRTSLFRQLGNFDFTPTGQFTDSMAKITKDLMELNPSIKELPDDRGSLYYIDGELKESAFLDSSVFNWSTSTRNSYGYHHTRNWSRAAYMVESRAHHRPTFDHEKSIQPPQEALRLIAWLYVMASEAYAKEVLATACEFGITEPEFLNYIEMFKEFHPWISV